jgi:hypothetical protein
LQGDREQSYQYYPEGPLFTYFDHSVLNRGGENLPLPAAPYPPFENRPSTSLRAG